MLSPGPAHASLDLAGALVTLADVGPPSELRAQGPSIAARALDLDRVLLSKVSDGMLCVEALHLPAQPLARRMLQRLQQGPVSLAYPLLEGEIIRRRRALLVRCASGEPLARQAFSDVLGWTEYVAAPIVLDGRAIGLLHGDRQPSEREVHDGDLAALSAFAVGFALVYERAVLRHRLRVQLQDLRYVANWADARTSELGDRAISLDETGGTREQAPPPQVSVGAGAGLRDLLTRREIEVLRLVVAGETNAGIAKELVVSKGTVKFHVKNILRKLHATNRADATAKYLRLTLPQRASVSR
jgi:DNA-binding CsgD family transcriptional regulator